MKSYCERFEHNFDNAIIGAIGGFVFFIMTVDFNNYQINNILLRAVFATFVGAIMVAVYSLWNKKH